MKDEALTREQMIAELEEHQSRQSMIADLEAHDANKQPPPEAGQDLLNMAGDAGNTALGAAGSAASGTSQGFWDLADIAASPLTGVAAGVSKISDALFGTKQFTGWHPLSAYPGFKQVKGLMTDRATPEGQSTVNDAIRTGFEWGAGGAGRGAVKATEKMAAKLAGREATTEISKQLPDALRNIMDMGKRNTTDIFMGAGAATGEQIEEAVKGHTDDSGGLQILGGLAGAMRGKAKSLGRSPLSAGEQQAEKFMTSYAADPEAAMMFLKRRLADGEFGDIADLTNDKGLADVLRFMTRHTDTGPQLRDQLENIAKDRNIRIEDDLQANFGKGAADEALPLAKRAVDEQVTGAGNVRRGSQERLTRMIEGREDRLVGAQDALDDAVGAADTVATRLEDAVNPGATPAQTSEGLHKALAEKNKQLKSVMSGKWGEFEASGRVDTVGLKKVFDDVMDTLPEIAVGDFKSKFARVARNLDELSGRQGTGAAPEEIQHVLADMKAVVNEAASSGATGPLEHHLGTLVKQTDEFLNLSTAGKSFKEAKAATIDWGAKTGSKQAGKALRGEPELAGRKLNAVGNDGAVTRRILQTTDDPEVTEAFGRTIMADAAKEIDKRGKLSQAFIIDRQDVLELYPELKTRLQAAVEGRVGLAKATEAATVGGKAAGKRLTKLTKDKGRLLKKARSREESRVAQAQNKSALGQFTQGTEARVKKLLMTDTNKSRQELKQLYDAMKDAGGKKAFKAFVGEQVRKIAAPAKGGESAVDARAIDKMDQMTKALTESGILSEKKAAMAKQGLDKVKTKQLKDKAILGGVEMAGNEVDDIMASVLTTSVFTKFMTGAQSLMVNGMIRRAIKGYLLGRKYDPEVMEAMNGFITDPKRYLEAVEGAKTTKEAANSVLTKMIGRAQATKALAGEDDKEL